MKKEEINLKILELKFQSYISRAHTTFEVGVSLIPTIILGVAGIFFALQQADIVIFNKYYLLRFSIPTISISFLVGGIMLRVIFDSRKHRNKIETLMKDIRDKKFILSSS